MKLLWLCNMAPGAVREKRGGKRTGGLWLEHVLSDLSGQENITLHLLFPDRKVYSGAVSEKFTYASFREKSPYVYQETLEQQFSDALAEFQPDVIHIWGTEYAHTLAMVNACEKADLLDRTAVSIQGLCSVIAGHYTEGIPAKILRSTTFRDFLRGDNILQQQKKFRLRGEQEVKALQKVSHVLGRTDWDYACTREINPQRQYHLCNETLRAEFYKGVWSYPICRKHRIFAPGCSYPVKGFHLLLQAFSLILKEYPDATLAVPGKSFLKPGFFGKLREGSYQRYLCRLAADLGVADKIEFLGSLDAGAMRREFLDSHVFTLPSVIENSPNSLGEAMLLGVPAVAADVGGVSTLLRHGKEGYIYQSSAPYMLAHYVMKIFEQGAAAEDLGREASAHARQTHDPEQNLQALLDVYETLAK